MNHVNEDSSGEAAAAAAEPSENAVAVLNNGDVEMESENEEDEISAPVGLMPIPKVSIIASCAQIMRT